MNGGEISRRLHARQDLNIYDIAVAEMTGFCPLVEGGVDADPGTKLIAQAAGDCRLIPFNYSATQGYVIEASDTLARFYTNDVRLMDGLDPVALELPYSLAQIRALTWEQSFDVLYLFHGAVATQELTRISADAFELNDYAFKNGPFEPRNSDESIMVTSSAISGAVELEASAPIFAATDVGGLFKMEVDDFGDITAWEPGITVTRGQLLVWSEKVYRVAGGTEAGDPLSLRTGSVAPVHAQGIEWDGIGGGTDQNDNAAGGVQLEYISDRFGILQITAFTDSTHVDATVLRRLPFTAATSYEYEGGYYDEWGNYVPPTGGVSYNYGTWRWSFGSFSNTRGWPSCGAVFGQRLWLFKDNVAYASVVGDYVNHASYNDLGEISLDMALILYLDDPDPVCCCAKTDKGLMYFTARRSYLIGPSNAAQGVGPGNTRAIPQSTEGALAGQVPVDLDGHVVYIGKSRRRILDAEIAIDKEGRRASSDMTRYARHIGSATKKFTELTSQTDPNRLIWAARSDGSLAKACTVPEEQVLGWSTRPLASGMEAVSICGITDPDGELDQLWIAASHGGATWVLLMDQYRQEGDESDPVYLDMAVEYDGASGTSFAAVAPHLAGLTAQVWDVERDAVWLSVTVDETGGISLPLATGHFWIGLPYDARVKFLKPSAGSDDGPSLTKVQRSARVAVKVIGTRGLRVTGPGGQAQDLEQLTSHSLLDSGFAADEGLVIADDVGDFTRDGLLTIERVAPLGGTILGVQQIVGTGAG